MLLRDEDTAAFKKWLEPKLDKISDADAEVLADYVIALVTANETEGSIRKNCIESLSDFLQDNTASFVDDVVKILKTKSYVPRAPTNLNGTGPQSATNQQKQREDSQVGPISSIVGTSNSEYAPHALHAPHATSSAPFHAPKGPAATRPAKAQHRLPDRPTAPSPAHPNTASGNAQQSSRKRKLVQRDTSETRDSKDAHYNRTGAGQRPIKQTARRDGKNSLRGGAVAFEPQNSFPPAFAPMPNMLHLANLPPPPPGPMPFDMNDPMAFFTMMAALGTNMAGMPPLPSNNSPGNGANGRVRQGRCHDYHEKGFCARGDMCAFQHGGTNSAFNDAPEYDPDQPSLSAAFAESAHKRAGPYNSGKRGRRTRAPFSMPGPLYDRTNTTLVVEQIPEEHFSEDDVRGFFSDFGTITEVEMQAHKRLAIVKFEDHAAANQAYMSPKAVFENRFVKVYWYKKDMGGALEAPYGDVDMADDENDYEDSGQVLDPEEIARRQAEAQKAFEERRRKIEEAEAKSADIDRQLQEKDAEMRKIRQQLAELAGDDISGLDEEYSEDLATLQAEAENLFAQKEPIPSAGRGRGYPPRGGYRGRVYTPFFRERGAPRGAYRGRGRGAFAAPFPGSRSSVKRLDNRPRRLAIAGIEKGSPRDEALRQYLVNLPECTSIEPHPEDADTLILTFEQRYQAETFLDNSRQIPDTGPLELSWIPNDAFGGLPASTTTKYTDADASLEIEASDDDDSSHTIEDDDTKVKPEPEEDAHAADSDMDVADDVDQWF